MFKSMPFMLALLSLSATATTDNPFLAFQGSYSVAEKQCFVNNERMPDETCATFNRVAVVFDKYGLVIYEIGSAGTRGYGIYEQNYLKGRDYSKMTIQGDALTATWIFTRRDELFQNSDLSELDQMRTLSRTGNAVSYTFYHRESTPLTKESSLMRVLTLNKL
jgi:hypothetical protein